MTVTICRPAAGKYGVAIGDWSRFGACT